MKQAIIIMAVVMAALLLTTGLIVSGSLEQSERLDMQIKQARELRLKLQSAEEQLSALDESERARALELKDAAGQRDAALAERDAALEALAEANGAATHQSQALMEARAAHEREIEEWQQRLRDKNAGLSELDTALAQALGARDDALARADSLAGELDAARRQADGAALEHAKALEALKDEQEERIAAARAETRTQLRAEVYAEAYAEAEASLQTEHDENLQALEKTHAEALSALETACEARRSEAVSQASEAFKQEALDFLALLDVWSSWRGGDASAETLTDAESAFASRYPSSQLALPDEAGRFIPPEGAEDGEKAPPAQTEPPIEAGATVGQGAPGAATPLPQQTLPPLVALP